MERAVAGAEIEIDAATYRDYETTGETSNYDYEPLFTDGSRRVCAFAYTVGDEATHPYLGFWTENGRFYCKRLVDRLQLTAHKMDNYLPPLSAPAN
ncbi:MAG TPA: hypothetical protein VF215_06775 [Thermoanaerobaculia bacterium]